MPYDRYVGKFTNIQNSWLAAARNQLLRYIVDRGVFMKIAEKEILQNAAISIYQKKADGGGGEPST